MNTTYRFFLLLLGCLLSNFCIGQTPGLPEDHGQIGDQNAGGSQSVVAEQTLNLIPGWNWFSCYVECSDALFNDLKGSIAQNTSTAMLKDQSHTIMLQDGSWSGSSGIGLANESMYMINVEEPVTVVLHAPFAVASSHQIELSPGWNWIGFPSANAISLEEALASIQPNEGDMIKNAAFTSSYMGSWSGALHALEPGMGYMYYNSGATTMVLTFPSSNGGE